MVLVAPAVDEDTMLERAAALAADFATRAADHDRDASVPFENFEALRIAGLLNLTVPVEFGGPGAGLSTVCRVVGQIAQGDASTAPVLAMHSIYHALFARARRRPPGMQERVRRESVAGAALISVLRVEPELGTPACPSGRQRAIKYLATTNAIRAVDIALGVTGNPGLSRSHPLERHHRDVLCRRIHSPRDDMVLLGAGKAASEIT
jgi:alkylation response protein AidB-like acyl-CoA dehydrogenase